MIRQFQTICIVPTWQAKHAKSINMQSCKTAYFSRIDKLLSMTWKFYINMNFIVFGSNQTNFDFTWGLNYLVSVRLLSFFSWEVKIC